MPEVPATAIEAAARVMLRQYDDEFDASHLSWQDFEGAAREVLGAAAPILAEAVAQKVKAHADRQFPPADPGKRDGQPDAWRAWRRHFGIAARVAAGAFTTDAEMRQQAAEAFAAHLEGCDGHRNQMEGR